MQQKKRKNKGEEPEKINASFTNQKTEEETKQQGNVGYSGTNARGKKPKPNTEMQPSKAFYQKKNNIQKLKLKN